MIDRNLQYVNPDKWLNVDTDVSKLTEFDINVIKTSLNKDWHLPTYKMRWFQGQAQITKWAKYRQFLLELRNTEEAIETLEYDIEKGQAECVGWQHAVDTSRNPGEVAMAKVELKRTTRQIARSTRMLDDIKLTRHYYLDLIREFLDSPEGLIPDGSGRKWDAIVHSDEQDMYEKQIWTNRLAKQAACDIMFYGRIGIGNMDAILQMPEDQQAETFVLATDYALELSNYQKKLQLSSSERAAQGLPADLKELQFPEEPIQQLTGKPRTPGIQQEKSMPKIENTGDDLDVYNV
jgi:hypothetical protein